MPLIPFATFLAGAILSLVLPLALLVAVTMWYHLAVRRVPGPPRETPRGRAPERPAVANPTPANPLATEQPPASSRPESGSS